MPTYVALLRSVNVGGRKVSMEELRDVFADLGHTNVRTYIQSGNVVFTAKGRKENVVRSAIEAAIERGLGLDVTVLLRAPAELAQVLEANPYADAAYVTFLDGLPDSERVAELDPTAYLPDLFKVVGREVYVHAPNGYGRTKINNAFFERKLATRATTRNLRTVATLYEWASS
jgi:uncharacterized protein (DUF1697 family)